MNELQKAAEILVECGYAERQGENDKRLICYYENRVFMKVIANPFEDTLNSRRQLDAIWNWIMSNKQHLLILCPEHPSALSEWDDRDFIIRRIHWCLKQFMKNIT